MKKMLAVALLVFSIATLAAQNRLLDQPMLIKNLSMKVGADCFTATTFLEFEFYNPNDREIEGLYRFALLPNQVITAFQLELNGRFRDGSIEEKWKARNAYNTIVGKRIDPALLTLEWGNNYRLNIYPVPAKGSRKITMTVQQSLQEEKGRLWYRFALNKTDTAKQFQLTVKTTGCAYPSVGDGFIANQYFHNNQDGYFVNKNAANVALWQSVSFSFPVNNNIAFCTQEKNGKNFFAIRLKHEMPEQLELHPKKLLVYWDVSASSAKRQTGKEMNFLKQFVQKHEVDQLSIIGFSDRAMPVQTFYPNQNRDWINYLQSLAYDGATRIDQLNFSDASADAIFLFSDGFANWGSRQVKPSAKPLYAISSADRKDSVFLKSLIGNSGGTFIDLAKQSVPYATDKASFALNQLISIQSSTGKTPLEKIAGKNGIILYGELPQDDTLSFVYGNLSHVYKTERIFLGKNRGCTAMGIDRLSMLCRFPSLYNAYDWEEVLEYGLKEKIVTVNTAYIVLERAEDYIKYNIAPPKELEDECARQGYITKSTKTWRQQLREKDEYEILNGVVNLYNEKLKQWDPSAGLIHLSRIDFERANYSTISSDNTAAMIRGSVAGLDMSANMSEVVVVGYGTQRRSQVTGSVSMITRNELSSNAFTVEQALEGRVAGVQVTASNGFIGSGSTVMIRGISSLTNTQPLYILDGFPVNGNINELVSVNEIESITVLKDASATSIYGSRAGNGVIVITRKKYQPNTYRYSGPRRYRLKDMEDEEYLAEIKEVSRSEKLKYYATIRSLYADNASFYIDIAQHIFESGFKQEAINIISNAAEVSNGDISVLLAIAYSFEDWKEFDKAIELYRQVLSIRPDNLPVYRDLGWALYQAGEKQEAVETFYNAIKQNFETGEYYHVYTKASMLSEMNSIIAAHKDSLDLSRIPAALVHPMPVDLRIILAGNAGYIYNMEIKEPGGRICSRQNPASKNGGYFDKSRNYYGYPSEYNIKNAIKGKYRISIGYYDYYGSNGPQMVRIICFRNYGRKEQRLSIQNVIMNNQNGIVEIGEVEW